jgi:hypothetical protein
MPKAARRGWLALVPVLEWSRILACEELCGEYAECAAEDPKEAEADDWRKLSITVFRVCGPQRTLV